MPARSSGSQIAFVALVALGPLAFGCVEPWAAAPLFLAVVALAAVTAWRQGLDSTSLLAAAPFLILALLGAVQALAPRPIDGPIDVVLFTASRHRTLWAISFWGTLAGAAALACALARDRRASLVLFWAVSIAAGLVGVVGILQGLATNARLYGLREVPVGSYTVFGPYYNRNHAGNVMMMALPLALYCLSEALRTGKRGVDGMARAFVLSIPTLAILAGLFACRSVGAAIGALAGVVTAAAILMGPAPLVVLGLGSVVGVLAFHGQFEAFAAHHTVVTRLSLWRSSLQMAQDFPIFGVGLGAFRTAFGGYQEDILLGLGDHAHNDWLEMACEAGWPVAVAVVTGLVAAIAMGLLSGRGEKALGLRAAAAIGALSFLFHGMIDFSLHIPANAVLFAALVGVSVSHASESSRFKTLRLAPCLLFAALTIIAVRSLATRGAADAVLKFAGPGLYDPDRERAVRLAYALDPRDSRVSGTLAHLALVKTSHTGEWQSLAEATRTASRQLALEPWEPFIILTRGHTLRQLGRERDAWTDYRAYWRLMPWARPVEAAR